jgi:hypothetical protein
LLPGLVGPVTVVMVGVFAEHRPQVPLVGDQHPVGALASYRAYPPLGIAVRPGRPRRSLDHCDALVGEDLIERAGELGVTIPDEESEHPDPVPEVHDEVACLLGGPSSGRVGGHAKDVHAPGSDLHDEQDVQPFQQDRVHIKKVAGQKALGLSAQERPPRGARCRSGSRSAPRRRPGTSCPGRPDGRDRLVQYLVGRHPAACCSPLKANTPRAITQTAADISNDHPMPTVTKAPMMAMPRVAPT